ncbi:hypothetical protein NQT62_08475 [Limnobacter humi]|uniref:Uncharacterized protein n=1 Tax=Limnobacter humi TaxID=1778671 RepID=A0ABT1WG58_9BURK|nr:hypothetical protein [Limnobacter humi]MCQ8896465.1 hypothetical protein [Limnobacter humi]
MSQTFQRLASDHMALHKGARDLDECNCHNTLAYDGKDRWVAEVPVLTCDCLWRIYQREAEHIVAPGGVLIADPVARNQRINAAYAALWLSDPRFEWAGLAAFASKQVGCGLLHAADNMNTLREGQHRATQAGRVLVQPSAQLGVAGVKGVLSAADVSVKYVYDTLALGNTTLFLDIYPLHMFYAKRGLAEMRKCIEVRKKIIANSRFPIQWPVESKLEFGKNFPEIIPAFEAIERGDTVESVRLLARHEQLNILQPTIYDDGIMVALLGTNQAFSSFAYVTGLSTSFEEKVQLTLANQCRPLSDGRSIEFSHSPLANLANFDERMPFVLRAARQFHSLLIGPGRQNVESAIREIAQGRPIR